MPMDATSTYSDAGLVGLGLAGEVGKNCIASSIL